MSHVMPVEDAALHTTTPSLTANGAQAGPQDRSLVLPAFLLTIAEVLPRGGVEQRQLYCVIHQLFWSEKAHLKFAEDPEGFILNLKVRPRVKAALGLMKSTLLARRVLEPEMNWWSRHHDGKDEGDESTPAPVYASAA